MTTLPPLDVTVSAPRWSCVPDIGLLLSPWSFMSLWRLAPEMSVVLMPSFWDVLDGADYYLRHPEALAPLPEVTGGGTALAQRELIVETLGQWQTARLEADLPSIPIYWAGDASHESLLPKDVGTEVIPHFATLAQALDRRLQQREGPNVPGHLFPDCMRDAVALTAALGRHRPIIFALGNESGEGHAPNLCQFIVACGIECRKAPWPERDNPMRQYLLPALVRSGVAELVWTGMPLVAVHIVAPRAFLITGTGEESAAGESIVSLHSSAGAHGDPWERAVALWYTLS